MTADERIDIREGRSHTASKRSEAWRGSPRVGPHDTMCMPAECGHLTGEDAGVVALPAVGDDQYDGTAGHAPPAIEIHELANRAPDARAPRPVRHQCSSALEREIGVGVAQRASQAGEPRAEHEDLGLCSGTDEQRLDGEPRPARKMEQLPDLLVMPALGVKTPGEIIDTVRGHAALDLIWESRANGTELAGACTGTFFLAESGILDGLLATTSWWLGPAFRARYPAVLLDETRIIAQDAQITTAGAAFAHIDLALSIVQQHSPSLADLTARYLLIGDPPSQAAFAVPTMLARADPTMAAFEQWVRERIAEPLQISAAARDLGISERTLQRTTASVVGMSPLHFIQQVRLDEATFLLRDTSMSASAIAAAVGYRNAGTLRALVRKRRNSTLGALRSGRPPGRL